MNAFIRSAHRWLAIVFMALVVANTVFLVLGRQSVVLGVVTLIPLFLMMVSGLWLFALPYVRRRAS